MELAQNPDGGKLVTVCGERVDHMSKEGKGRGLYSETRNFGSFRRSLQVGDYVSQRASGPRTRTAC